VDLRDSRRQEIIHAQQLLRAGKTIKAGLEKYFDKKAEVITRRLDQAEEFDGYSCILSTRPLPKDQLVHLYFDKDLVEKAFRALKGVIKLQPLRHWLSQRVIAHIFICYLAYLLLALLKYRLKPLDISPENALNELNTMYKVYLRDSKQTFKLSRIVALTKRQETILKAINPKLLKPES
jgi:transposase